MSAEMLAQLDRSIAFQRERIDDAQKEIKRLEAMRARYSPTLEVVTARRSAS